MAEVYTKVKNFKVVAVSVNIGSFGHRGVVIVAQDGEAYEAHVSISPPTEQRKVGDILIVGWYGSQPRWFPGWECVRRLEDFPPNVLRKVWRKTNG